MHVVYNLNFEDFVNLQMASSDLFRVLNNESLNREMAKVSLPPLLSFPLRSSTFLSLPAIPSHDRRRMLIIVLIAADSPFQGNGARRSTVEQLCHGRPTSVLEKGSVCARPAALCIDTGSRDIPGLPGWNPVLRRWQRYTHLGHPSHGQRGDGHRPGFDRPANLEASTSLCSGGSTPLSRWHAVAGVLYLYRIGGTVR